MSHEHPFTVNWTVVRFVSLHLYSSAFKASACSCLKFLTSLEQNKHLSHRWNFVSFTSSIKVLQANSAPSWSKSFLLFRQSAYNKISEVTLVQFHAMKSLC